MFMHPLTRAIRLSLMLDYQSPHSALFGDY